MYGSSKALTCVLCGRADSTVTTRTVACADLCRCEEERIACEKCERESYEENGADEWAT